MLVPKLFIKIISVALGVGLFFLIKHITDKGSGSKSTQQSVSNDAYTTQCAWA